MRTSPSRTAVWSSATTMRIASGGHRSSGYPGAHGPSVVAGPSGRGTFDEEQPLAHPGEPVATVRSGVPGSGWVRSDRRVGSRWSRSSRSRCTRAARPGEHPGRAWRRWSAPLGRAEQRNVGVRWEWADIPADGEVDASFGCSYSWLSTRLARLSGSGGMSVRRAWMARRLSVSPSSDKPVGVIEEFEVASTSPRVAEHRTGCLDLDTQALRECASTSWISRAIRLRSSRPRCDAAQLGSVASG